MILEQVKPSFREYTTKFHAISLSQHARIKFGNFPDSDLREIDIPAPTDGEQEEGPAEQEEGPAYTDFDEQIEQIDDPEVMLHDRNLRMDDDGSGAVPAAELEKSPF